MVVEKMGLDKDEGETYLDDLQEAASFCSSRVAASELPASTNEPAGFTVVSASFPSSASSASSWEGLRENDVEVLRGWPTES
jgi:hypothetical protein